MKASESAREAAANVVKAYRGTQNGNWQARIRKGECDDGDIVQAFAQAEARGREQGLREAAAVAATRKNEWRFAIENGLRRVSVSVTHASAAETEANVIEAAITALIPGEPA